MMLKKFGKKITMVFLLVSLIALSSLSVFAGSEGLISDMLYQDVEMQEVSIEDYVITIDGQDYTIDELLQQYKAEGAADLIQSLDLDDAVSLSSNPTLSDYQTINQTVTGSQFYSINVNDPGQRRIFIGSTDPIKTLIICPTFPNFVSFDSGYYRIGSKISWNFIPGVEYLLLVVPQTSSTTVSVNMTPTTDSSWLVHDSYTLEEKNILMGNQAQIFDVAFKNRGTYRITVSTNIDLLAAAVQTSFGHNESVLIQNSSYSFIVQGYPTDNMLDHRIILHNLMSPNVGATYTLTIERIN